MCDQSNSSCNLRCAALHTDAGVRRRRTEIWGVSVKLSQKMCVVLKAYACWVDGTYPTCSNWHGSKLILNKIYLLSLLRYMIDKEYNTVNIKSNRHCIRKLALHHFELTECVCLKILFAEAAIILQILVLSQRSLNMAANSSSASSHKERWTLFHNMRTYFFTAVLRILWVFFIVFCETRTQRNTLLNENAFVRTQPNCIW